MSEVMRVGVIGTSWWADATYLPALSGAAGIAVTAVAGRDPERTRAFAERWGVNGVFSDAAELIDSGSCDAVVIATTNVAHHPLALRAIERGLHVLCEKPLAMTVEQADEIADAAEAAGLVTMVPFTYRFMPGARFLKRLIDDGYLGRHYHLNLRYYAGFGRSGRYTWRFDRDLAGAGAVGDIGSHFLHLAEWYYGEIVAVCADLATLIERPELDPAGRPYEQLDDSAALLLRFAGGAHGILQASTVAYEDTRFGQVHELDFHGSQGTLRYRVDWAETQEIHGARVGEGMPRLLEIPDDVWGPVRRDDPTETLKDVIRLEGRMVREFVAAARAGKRVRPDARDGARVQRLIAAAQRSAETGAWAEVD